MALENTARMLADHPTQVLQAKIAAFHAGNAQRAQRMGMAGKGMEALLQGLQQMQANKRWDEGAPMREAQLEKTRAETGAIGAETVGRGLQNELLGMSKEEQKLMLAAAPERIRQQMEAAFLANDLTGAQIEATDAGTQAVRGQEERAAAMAPYEIGALKETRNMNREMRPMILEGMKVDLENKRKAGEINEQQYEIAKGRLDNEVAAQEDRAEQWRAELDLRERSLTQSVREAQQGNMVKYEEDRTEAFQYLKDEFNMLQEMANPDTEVASFTADGKINEDLQEQYSERAAWLEKRIPVLESIKDPAEFLKEYNAIIARLGQSHPLVVEPKKEVGGEGGPPAEEVEQEYEMK